MTKLLVQNISHAFSNEAILKDVSFVAKPSELTCLVGPSGCGKTTLLRLISGLERLQHGNVMMGDELLNQVPARKRRIGFVFQQPSLFPHLNVRNNIIFGLHHAAKSEKNSICEKMLALVDLQDMPDRYPHQLSGGQQQRVALARALAPEPRLMLLDEPFANLDQVLRTQIRDQVVDILKSANIPTIMVTHNPQEALAAADHIVLLQPDGQLHQAGTPVDIRERPADEGVARFFELVPA